MLENFTRRLLLDNWRTKSNGYKSLGMKFCPCYFMYRSQNVLFL